MQSARRILCFLLAVCLFLCLGVSGAAAEDAPTPTAAPTEPTPAPTAAPTEPTPAPTAAPTEPTQPSAEAPTEPTDSTVEPTAPTEAPTEPSQAPTESTAVPTLPTQPQPTQPRPTQPQPTQPRPTQPWTPRPTQGTWPWDVGGESAKTIFVGPEDPVSVPDDANIESRDESGSLVYTVPADWTAQDVINWFILNYRLDPETFAVSFYCPGTGESASFNAETWMLAANTYMLPLNLYLYEQQAEGVYNDGSKIAGVPIGTAHERSIVDSDNQISQQMVRTFGSYRKFKEAMLTSYSDRAIEDVPEEYFTENYFNTAFMRGVLESLYRRQTEFPELLELMERSMPDRYLKRYAGETRIAHKHGTFESAYHDVGIVFTEEPFLLAVFTYDVIGMASGEDLIGRLCLALMSWQNRPTVPDVEPTEPETTEPETELPTPELTTEPATEAETELQTAAPTTVPATTAQSEEPAQPERAKEQKWFYIVFPAVILALTVGAILIFRRRR